MSLTEHERWHLTCASYRNAIAAAEAREDAMKAAELRRALRQYELKRPVDVVAPAPKEGA